MLCYEICPQDSGIGDLTKVYHEKGSLRRFMASIVILGYELFVTYYVGNKSVDFDLCKEILEEQLKLYPNGYFFRFFKGRYHMIKVMA